MEELVRLQADGAISDYMRAFYKYNKLRGGEKTDIHPEIRDQSAAVQSLRDDVCSWSVDSVADWARGMPDIEPSVAQALAEKLREHDVTGRDLISLTRQDLLDMEVRKIGHVRRILHAVQSLLEP